MNLDTKAMVQITGHEVLVITKALHLYNQTCATAVNDLTDKFQTRGPAGLIECAEKEKELVEALKERIEKCWIEAHGPEDRF